ncbi:FMN-dependent NADH-azoreductase [Mesonia hippocampi]|uniref:FMN dependent NADH:quinone oxidoreductase n=1 Tax=Mesonia hippocampi TaxID=1628250 RepID=A0A840EFE4_9FLAO|nr:NAD(P)H-dependent oxidoreductase [Mesonia hippocampi]MBB4117922.1 FMN-dependent NADH-azoreductase [Mesonia hippocampi]
MNILRIDSSVRVQNSKSRELTDFFLKKLSIKQDFNLKIRDVGINPPAFPTDDFIKANYTVPENRTDEMKSILANSDALIDELLWADKIVITSPMYNFTVSATLKVFIDNIVRVGRTFYIDENGDMQGLLNDKKLLVITSRGAMFYGKNKSLESFDFQESYLKSVFLFMGISDSIFVNTEAQDFGTAEMKMINFEHSKNQLSKLSKIW